MEGEFSEDAESLGLEVRSWCSLLVLGADLVGALLRLSLLGVLSGSPTNVTLSVAHKHDSMNAKAPIVAANSATCTTTRAVITKPSPATEVVVTFSTSKRQPELWWRSPRGR